MRTEGQPYLSHTGVRRWPPLLRRTTGKPQVTASQGKIGSASEASSPLRPAYSRAFKHPHHCLLTSRAAADSGCGGHIREQVSGCILESHFLLSMVYSCVKIGATHGSWPSACARIFQDPEKMRSCHCALDLCPPPTSAWSTGVVILISKMMTPPRS